MPNQILILLVIAGAGVLGSIALMVCNAVMGKRNPAPETDDDFDLTEEEDSGDTDAVADVPAAAEPAQEVKFTPLGQDDEPTTVSPAADAKSNAEDDEPVTVGKPPLRLVKPEDKGSGSAVVGGLTLRIGNAQDIGKRPQQQDAFAITPLEEELVVRDHGVMAVVCDGMGGMENGAEAANMGAIQFMRAYLAVDKVQENTLVDAVYAANRAVYGAFQGKNGAMAGTTLIAASILPDGLRFVSVGDSHLYLFRKGKTYQLNRDHNYFSELMEEVKAGRMTLEEAQHHPERAHLTSFVGIEKLELVDYNIEPVPLKPGDRVLLCSDGLFKTLSLQEINSIIASSQGCSAQDELLRAVLAKDKRKQDNVTLVMLYCDPV